MRERHHSDGRQVRIFRQLSLREEAEQMAENQIRTYMQGGPSTAFFPAETDFDTAGHAVVFEASMPQSVKPERVTQGRKGDLAKRSGDLINGFLERRQEFESASIRSTEGFISRNFERIVRFARTLKNKGKLHPQMGEILDI